jgi:hypothetical protein
MKPKKEKHITSRVRKENKTDRGDLHTKVIPDKKKKVNKEKCRGKIEENE